MAKDRFKSWIDDNNKDSLYGHESSSSKKFDRLLNDSSMQKSISSSKKNQMMLCVIESKITSDYPRSIDYKLREACNALTMVDFANAAGF